MLQTPAAAAAENQHEPVMAAEDPWRRGCHRDDLDDDDELEEGEIDAGCHSETDTEEYYNRHSPSESDETVSDRETTSVARGWGGTGKRGCSGSSATAVSPPSAETEQPTAIVDAAEPEVVLQPTPSAFATPNLQPSVPTASARAYLSGGQSGSAQPKHDDAMEIAAAGAANPPTETAVHQEQPVAPPVAAAGEQPALVHHQQPASPPPAAGVGGGRQDPNGYTCKKCGMWFASGQGLGGHMVGHKNRELAAAAAGMPPADDGDVPAGRRNPKPERPHVCDQCGAEFRTGVQLGGHKRKHWTGPPIVPKKKPRVVVQPLPPPEEAAADLKLALAVTGEAPPALPPVKAARPAVERSPEPAPRPPAVTRILLFGIDIGAGAGAGVQAPEAQQGSPATESSASTGEQQ